MLLLDSVDMIDCSILLTSSWTVNRSSDRCGYPLWLQQVHLGVRDRWLWRTMLFAATAVTVIVIASTATATASTTTATALLPMAARRMMMMSALVCHGLFGPRAKGGGGILR